ncbi:ATPase domain protein [Novymonas esmeraldas]|uniref:ATPase domain protein n=1 Tax=Novymonas esmeraldas TaxID=1808958 RepID=A0AAW0ENP8_9TRYP
MSVDGHLIADVQRLRQLGGQSLFLVVLGGKGAGKSAALQSLTAGLPANTNARHVAAVTELLLATDATAPPDDELLVCTLNYAAVARGSSALGALAAPALSLRRFSVVVADDVDVLWHLCSANGLLPSLQRLLQAVLTGNSCAVVASASSQDALPLWLTERRVPVVYPIRDLTEAGMRRLLRSLPQSSLQAHSEELISAQTLSTSRQMLVFNACMTLESAKCDATPEQLRALAHEGCAFLHHRRPPTATSRAPPTLYGLAEVRHRLTTLVAVFAARSRPGGGGRLMGALPSSTGVLLHGPSGCGKSNLARQVAIDFPTVPCFVVECTTLFSKYLGESEERLRELYRRARACAPAVVVLEDMDVIAQSRGAMEHAGGDGGGKHQLDVSRRMLAGLLCELDGVADNSGVLTIGVTNAPHVLDAAVLRQGRLETLLYVPPLTRDGAAEMCADFFERFAGAEEERRERALRVAGCAVGCPAASLQYVLRKVFEASARGGSGWTVTEAGAPALPSAAEVEAVLLECRSVLQQVPCRVFG